jgi:hypothetical protein
VLLGFGAAWRLILHDRPFPSNRGSNAWNPVIELAKATPQQELEGFGAVRLDTFLVAEASAKPGMGHWKTAEYDEEDWWRTFGAADLIKAKDVPTGFGGQK